MLLNFKSENYSGVSSVFTQNRRLQDQKPAVILNQILEDYRSCVEIPADKRPDSLFSAFKGDFTVKIPFSKLVSCHFSELLESYLSNKHSSLIAIDVFYDIPPTCEKVLNLLGNLTSFKNFDVAGIISAHGCFYSAFLKSLEQWKSFNDSKLYSWTNLVWNFCASASYPVMIVLANGTTKGSPGFLSKIDLDSMQKFCKTQDSLIKLAYTEDTQYDLPHKEPLSGSHIKEYTSDYSNRAKEYLKKGEFDNRHSYTAEKAEKKPYKLERSLKEKSSTPSKKLNLDNKDKAQEYIKTVQDYSVTDKPAATSRSRNFSSEPGNNLTHSKSYKDYLAYNSSNSQLKESIEKRQKPGILKTSSIDANDFKPSFSSYSSMTSPKDVNFARTFRESTEKFDEERTEKPSSILRNNWTHEKKESLDKKVNFSDSVFEVDDSIKGQMPEIKFSSGRSGKASKSSYDLDIGVKKALSSYRPSEYKSETLRNKSERSFYSSHELSSQPRSLRINETSPDTQYKDEGKNSWFCPKCSKSIQNTTYECGSCRYINWDRFYSLKSKESRDSKDLKDSKIRAESIPSRIGENRDFSKTFGSEYFEARKEAWKLDENQIRMQEKYSPANYGRMTSREFRYDR